MGRSRWAVVEVTHGQGRVAHGPVHDERDEEGHDEVEAKRAASLVGLPGVDDAVVVAVEEGDVLLEHAHAAGVAPLGPLRVARVHRLQSSREICMQKPGRGRLMMSVLNYLTCLIFCCCVIFFQNTELDSGELLMGELVALQEELAGWLVDYVVKPGSEYSII